MSERKNHGKVRQIKTKKVQIRGKNIYIYTVRMGKNGPKREKIAIRIGRKYGPNREKNTVRIKEKRKIYRRSKREVKIFTVRIRNGKCKGPNGGEKK